VEPLPPTGEKHQIATGDARDPLWAPDGKKLFYTKTDPNNVRRIVSVDIQTSSGFVVSKATPLPIDGLQTTGPRPYDITPNGKSFVIMLAKSQIDINKSVEQIIITLNWFEELKQRVPVH
jgi:Tol biopolymer transport system component